MLRLARKVDDMGGRSGLRLRKGRQKNHFQGGSNSSSVNSEDGTKPRRVGSWRALEKLSLYDDKEDLHDDADQARAVTQITDMGMSFLQRERPREP